MTHPQLKTPFELIGGQPAVDRIIDAFYDRMDTLPEAATIRALHASDLGSTRAVLKRYLAQWLGGPQKYSEERGHPMLRARHLPFSIGTAERDQWLHCMRGAMEQEIADAAVRDWILAKLASVADHMRNRAD
jgi:hemoglobin